MGIFQRLNREQGITIVFVTHEPDIALHTRRIIHIRDGRVSSDELVSSPRSAAVQLTWLEKGDGSKARAEAPWLR
ncbi:MAG: hypothetical protein HYY30_08725 [Chloroflexi bacterium]|nr:hypothetical protein [Chloroflexota bacterium]